MIMAHPFGRQDPHGGHSKRHGCVKTSSGGFSRSKNLYYNNHNNSNSVNNNNNHDDMGRLWLVAIQSSTAACLPQGGREGNNNNNNDNNAVATNGLIGSHHSMEAQLAVLDHSLGFLQDCQDVLLQRNHNMIRKAGGRVDGGGAAAAAAVKSGSNSRDGNGQTPKTTQQEDERMMTNIDWEAAPPHDPPTFLPLDMTKTQKRKTKKKKQMAANSNSKENRPGEVVVVVVAATSLGDGHDDVNNDGRSYPTNGSINRFTSSSSSSNPYASIFEDDDGDNHNDEEKKDEDEEEKEQVQNDDPTDEMERGYDEEAGDIPLYGSNGGRLSNDDDNNKNNDDGSSDFMDVLRLLIRLYSSQSDLLARKARLLSKRGEWVDGVVSLQEAINCCNEAMNLADTEVSKYEQEVYAAELQANVGGGGGGGNSSMWPAFMTFSKQRLYHLQTDADIIHVSSQVVVKAKDHYTKAAHKQKERLEKILKANLEMREQARKRMGEERWTNNKAPKNTFSHPRKAQKKELDRVTRALEQLATLEDVSSMEATASWLKDRTAFHYQSSWNYFLQQQQQEQSSTQFYYGSTDHRVNDGTVDRSRYNGLRPSIMSASYRQPGYPDASDYGWLYTGCNEDLCVEFFEKQYVQEEADENGIPGNIALPLVKLDWYYTTAECNVVMKHPMQGPSYLFTSQGGISTDLYVHVLENPRDHQKLRALYHKERALIWQETYAQSKRPKTKKKKNKRGGGNKGSNRQSLDDERKP